MTQLANLRDRLKDLLLKLGYLDTATDRRTFFERYIDAKISSQVIWQGSQQTFIGDLLEKVIKGGKEQLLHFLGQLDNSQLWGLDQQIELRRLISAIEQVTQQQWEQEFVTKRRYTSLEEGASALERREYRQARSLLKTAVAQIPSSEKYLAAKARYLQALAILGNDAPRDKDLVDGRRVDELMDAAVRLNPCKAYFHVIAFIKRDLFEGNPSSVRWETILWWRKQAESKDPTAYDELLSYLKHCQPDFYYQVW